MTWAHRLNGQRARAWQSFWQEFRKVHFSSQHIAAVYISYKRWISFSLILPSSNVLVKFQYHRCNHLVPSLMMLRNVQ